MGETIGVASLPIGRFKSYQNSPDFVHDCDGFAGNYGTVCQGCWIPDHQGKTG